MQSETAYFVPGAAIWRTLRNIRVVSRYVHSLHYMKTCRHPQNRKYITYRTAVRRGTEPRPQVACTETLVKFGRMVFRYANRQTETIRHNRHADHNTSHPYGGRSRRRLIKWHAGCSGNSIHQCESNTASCCCRRDSTLGVISINVLRRWHDSHNLQRQLCMIRKPKMTDNKVQVLRKVIEGNTFLFWTQALCDVM